MASYELDAGDPRAADILVAAIADPPPALVERIARAKVAQGAAEAERRALETLGRDWRSEVGQRTRRFVGASAGLVWAILPIIGAVTGTTPETYRGNALNACGFLIASIAIAIWARTSIFATRFNRGVVLGTLLWTPMCQLFLVLAGAQMGIPAAQLQTLNFLLWAAIFGVLAAVIDSGFLVTAGGYLVGLFVTARWPTMRAAMMSFGNLVLFASVLVIWRPMPRQP